ncbi:hypothetical protein DAEQUDRAFT_514652 [Daedalea quercina L-15889]|uniref:Uncharacterized protein n=1 Tax=Daedalea quercina L-15889 TaxID=1314783 RepID=A0A165MIA5_9APHY|nr:hypothetical protein DAEQUDRAFT_514652 [Daedalea quercina L-15889]
MSWNGDILTGIVYPCFDKLLTLRLFLGQQRTYTLSSSSLRHRAFHDPPDPKPVSVGDLLLLHLKFINVPLTTGVPCICGTLGRNPHRHQCEGPQLQHSFIDTLDIAAHALTWLVHEPQQWIAGRTSLSSHSGLISSARCGMPNVRVCPFESI